MDNQVGISGTSKRVPLVGSCRTSVIISRNTPQLLRRSPSIRNSGVSFFFSSTKGERVGGRGEKQSRHPQRMAKKERFARKAAKEGKKEVKRGEKLSRRSIKFR